MRRRSFLAGAGIILGLPANALAAAGDLKIPLRKLERLALSSSSYRANYDGRYAVATATPRLSHESFPGFVRQTFGLRHVELWDQQFGPGGATFEACHAVRSAARPRRDLALDGSCRRLFVAVDRVRRRV